MSWVFFAMLMAFCGPWMYRHWGQDGGRQSRLPSDARQQIIALEGELDARLEEIQRLDARVGELESRLDFAERMLSNHRPEVVRSIDAG